MFIFASGYTIASRYTSLVTKEEISQYFKKRIIRIYPIWWIGIFLWYICFWIFNINPHPYTEHFDGMGSFYLFSGFHGFFKADGGDHRDWFVGAILIYYVIYAIIAKYAKDDVDVFIISLSIYIVCYFYGILDNRFYTYYPVFIIGIFLGRYNILNKTHEHFSKIPIGIQGIIDFISTSSYATYLFHPALLSVVKYFNMKFGVTGMQELVNVFIAIPIVLLISYSVQKWVTKNIENKQITIQKKVLAPN